MCTVIVARNVFPGFPLVVAANRDEQLARPSEAVTYRRPSIGPDLLAPKDLQRGGTWNGVNAAGVFAAITNRADIVSARTGKTSRGDLVSAALAFGTAEEAFRALSRLQPERFNGFNLVVGDRDELYHVSGDGKELVSREITNNLFTATNLGCGSPGDPDLPQRIRNVLQTLEAHEIDEPPPRPASLRHLLNIHAPGRDGTCILDLEKGYGTKSSSVFRLSIDRREWQYWHRERPQDGRHVCQSPFDRYLSLPVIRPL